MIRWGRATLVLAGIGVLAVASQTPKNETSSGDHLPAAGGTGTPPVAPKPTAAQLKAVAVAKVHLERFDWAKSGFGTVAVASFTLRNDNDFAIKDVRIGCTYFAPSGTQLDTTTKTVYEQVPAKGKRSVREFSMGFVHGQAQKAGCSVEDYALP